MRIILLGTIFFTVCFSACNNKDKVPAGILPKDQMQSVLWDVMQAESFTNIRSNTKSDTLINSVLEDAKLQERVFGIHHISREDFYKSFSYYKEHTDLMMAILDSMTAQESRKETDRLAIKAKADTTNKNRIKDKSVFLKQQLNKLVADSTLIKNKQKAAAKAKQKKHLPKKHTLNAAAKKT